MTTQSVWVEIYSFRSLDEYQRFSRRLDELIANGDAYEIECDMSYNKGMVTGGRWIVNKSDGVIWRLIEPDFSFPGFWEEVSMNRK